MVLRNFTGPELHQKTANNSLECENMPIKLIWEKQLIKITWKLQGEQSTVVHFKLHGKVVRRGAKNPSFDWSNSAIEFTSIHLTIFAPHIIAKSFQVVLLRDHASPLYIEPNRNDLKDTYPKGEISLVSNDSSHYAFIPLLLNIHPYPRDF